MEGECEGGGDRPTAGRRRPPSGASSRGVCRRRGGRRWGLRSDGRPLGLGASSPPSGAGFGHLRRGRSGVRGPPPVPLGRRRWVRRLGFTVGCRGGGVRWVPVRPPCRVEAEPGVVPVRKYSAGASRKPCRGAAVGTSAFGRLEGPRSGRLSARARGRARGETVLRDWWLARLGPSGRWACLAGWTRLGRGRGLALPRRWRVCRRWAWFADARRALSRLLAGDGGRCGLLAGGQIRSFAFFASSRSGIRRVLEAQRGVPGVRSPASAAAARVQSSPKGPTRVRRTRGGDPGACEVGGLGCRTGEPAAHRRPRRGRSGIPWPFSRPNVTDPSGVRGGSGPSVRVRRAPNPLTLPSRVRPPPRRARVGQLPG